MEPRYACLSEANASHSHKMWTEVSSSVPHFLHMGSLLSPIIFKYLLKVLCPVSRPKTTLVCVLLKDNNRAPITGSGPGINSQACLCVLQGHMSIRLQYLLSFWISSSFLSFWYGHFAWSVPIDKPVFIYRLQLRFT